jgi:hypothetical protein
MAGKSTLNFAMAILIFPNHQESWSWTDNMSKIVITDFKGTKREIKK